MDDAVKRSPTLPSHGRPWSELKLEMDKFKERDFDPKSGRLPAYTYYYDDDLLEVQMQAYCRFFLENGLGKRRAFPSLGKMEDEVVAISLDLLGDSGGGGGVFTSGGTES